MTVCGEMLLHARANVGRCNSQNYGKNTFGYDVYYYTYGGANYDLHYNNTDTKPMVPTRAAHRLRRTVIGTATC